MEVDPKPRHAADASGLGGVRLLVPQALSVLETHLQAQDAATQLEAARIVLEQARAPLHTWDLYGTLSNRTEYTLVYNAAWSSGDWNTWPSGPISPGASSNRWQTSDSWTAVRVYGWVQYFVEDRPDLVVNLSFDLETFGSNSFKCETNIPGCYGWASYTGGWGGDEQYYLETST